MQIILTMKNGNNFYFIITEEYLNVIRQNENPRTNFYDTDQEYADNCALLLFSKQLHMMPTLICPPYGQTFYNTDDILSNNYLSDIKDDVSEVCMDDVLIINQQCTPYNNGANMTLPERFDMHFTNDADQVAFKLKWGG